jgi:hypothetical protein
MSLTRLSGKSPATDFSKTSNLHTKSLAVLTKHLKFMDYKMCFLHINIEVGVKQPVNNVLQPVINGHPILGPPGGVAVDAFGDDGLDILAAMGNINEWPSTESI